MLQQDFDRPDQHMVLGPWFATLAADDGARFDLEAGSHASRTNERFPLYYPGWVKRVYGYANGEGSMTGTPVTIEVQARNRDTSSTSDSKEVASLTLDAGENFEVELEEDFLQFGVQDDLRVAWATDASYTADTTVELIVWVEIVIPGEQ